MPYNFKPFGSGWFDCCCEPRKIICDDRSRIQEEFKQCEPEPPVCQSFVSEGFGGGFNGCGGGFGGFGGFGFGGGYTECGWAATKGWAWWEGNCYVNGPKPKYDEPDCEEFSLPGSDSCFDPCFDPCDALPT